MLSRVHHSYWKINRIVGTKIYECKILSTQLQLLKHATTLCEGQAAPNQCDGLVYDCGEATDNFDIDKDGNCQLLIVNAATILNGINGGNSVGYKSHNSLPTANFGKKIYLIDSLTA